ncbi:hypothetical protein EV421DRAFT_368615 [Armillaria borealis]|uniref:Secreted protein n=1 Tax=Armillaria borealis TaxID=47425 RepID=A0AA39JL47_9AGAR|nr:hypothetical protein EV421DRAFT_368615 [Armillaria borealis]
MKFLFLLLPRSIFGLHVTEGEPTLPGVSMASWALCGLSPEHRHLVSAFLRTWRLGESITTSCQWPISHRLAPIDLLISHPCPCCEPPGLRGHSTWLTSQPGRWRSWLPHLWPFLIGTLPRRLQPQLGGDRFGRVKIGSKSQMLDFATVKIREVLSIC